MAGITFPDRQDGQVLLIANIALYRLMGASSVDLQCKVDDINKEINIFFVQKPLVGEL